MGQLTVNPADELIKQLAQLGRMDDIAPKMLNAAAEPLKNAIKENLQSHNNTGELIESVSQSKPKKNRRGIWETRIKFTGKDKNTGELNGEKAFSLEWGSSKQQETPFIRPAVIATEQEALNIMQDVFNKEAK